MGFSFTSWLKNMRANLRGLWRNQPRSAARTLCLTRLSVELLEDRVVPSGSYLLGGPAGSLTTNSFNWSWDFSGAGYIDNASGYRGAITNPANFGPAGIVPVSIVTSNLSTITPATLAPLNGFISSWWENSQTTPYVTNITNFFLGGHDLILLDDDSAHDAIAAALGIPTSPSNGTVSNDGSPLFVGPFGTATNVTQGGSVGQLTAANIAAHGGHVGGTNSSGQITAAYWNAGDYAPGAGRLLIVADVDMWSTAGTATYTPTLNSNGKFALNGTAFIAQASEPALNASAGPLSPITEGTGTGAVTVATFTHGNVGGDPITATINWGVAGHTADPGTVVDLGGGSYRVDGTSPIYAEDGSYTITVSISDETASASPSTTLTVNEPALNVTNAILASVSEGQPAAQVTIATFTHANGVEPASAFTTQASWDGGHTFQPAPVTQNGDGSYTVRTTRPVFSEEGSQSVSFNITEDGLGYGSFDTLNVTEPAMVAASVAALGPINEGANLGTVTVASFTHGTVAESGIMATINWGIPGHTADAGAVVSDGNGSYHVTGISPTFTEEGSYAISVTINDESTSASTSTTLTVQDAPLSATGVNVSATEGTSFTGLVATFTDANPAATLADFPLANVTIHWGDGTASNATAITQSGGAGTAFQVFGSHTYAEEGTVAQPLSVTVTDVGGSNVPVNLDPTFGQGGIVATDFSGARDFGSSVAVAPNGNITVWGYAAGAYDSFTRYHADGTLDTSFGSGGHTGFSTSIGTNFAQEGMTVDATGRLLVSGWYYNGAGFGFAVLRFNADGTHDATFGSGGITIVGSMNPNAPEDLTLDSQGRILVVSSSGNDIAMVRLTANGTADASFGSNGEVITSNSGSASGIAVDPNGNMVVFGSTASGPSFLRYHADGSLDTSFGQNGVVAIQSPLTLAGHGMSIDGQGRIVLAGTFYTPANSEFAVARFHADGSPDTSFGSGGWTAVNVGNGGTANGLAVDSQGRILLAGSVINASNNSQDIGLARLVVNDSAYTGVTTSSTAKVTDAALHATGTPVSAVEGQPVVNVPVATFTDGDANAQAGDYSATIHWGDGETSAGSIAANGGGFMVTGSKPHPFAEEGLNSVSVSINDAGGATTDITTISAGTVSTFAAPAGLSYPRGMVIDGSGNLYVANIQSSTVSKITPSGVISTFVSSGLSSPEGLALDSSGNLYVANSGTNGVIKVTPAGVLSTFVASGLSDPQGMAFDSSGNLYVANWGNSTVSKVTPAGVVSTFVSSGLTNPVGVVFDSSGNLYIANFWANSVSKVTPGGVVSTFVSSGVSQPTALAMDSSDNLYVGNYGGYTVSKVTPAGAVSSFASGFSGPYGLAVDGGGNLYVSNYTNSSVSKVTPAGVVSTFVASTVVTPQGLAFAGGNLYVSSYGNNTVAQVTPAGVVTTFASVAFPEGLAIDGSGNLYVANYNSWSVSKITPAGAVSTFVAAGAGLVGPQGLAFDSSGNLYVANQSGFVSKVTPAGAVSTFVSGLNNPDALAFDGSGNLYVANSGDNTLSKVTSAGVVTTFVASGLSRPASLAFDAGGYLYVANAGNNTVTQVTPAGVATTFIASGLNSPSALAFDDSGNLYVANEGNNTVSKVPIVTTLTPAMSATATVSDAPLTATGVHVSATEGASFTGPVATFTDGKPGDNSAEMSATINWGDAHSTAGVVSYNGGTGLYTVQGTYVYAEDGSYTISVSIQDAGGATTDVQHISTTPTTTLSGLYDIYGVAVDAANNVYVAESLLNRVAVFAPGNPNPVNYLTGITNPTWVAFDSAGDLYVASAFSSTAGFFAPGHTTPSYFLNSISNPQALAIDASGNLYVSNAGNNTVTRYAAGNPTPTATLTGLNQPASLAVDSQGDVFVRNGNNTVSVFASGSLTPTATLTGFNNPQGLAIDAAGDLFVANYGASTVLEYSAGTLAPATTLTGVNGPSNLGFDRHGHLFVINSGNNTASEFAPGGQTPIATLTGLSQPIGFAIDAQGDLYVGNYSGAFVTEYGLLTTPGVQSTAAVSDAPLTRQPIALGPLTEGPFNGVVATFTDGNPTATTADFPSNNVTINWGDNTSSPGTVNSLGGGRFSISGSHDYDEGSFVPSVIITDVDGANTTAYSAYSTWVTAAGMNTARTYLAATTGLNGNLYAIGGGDNGGSVNTVESYNPSANTWTTLAPLNTPRSALGVTTGTDGRIYAIGGYNNGIFLNTVEVYDPNANTWTSLAHLNSIRYAPGVATGPDGRIYAIGGYDGNNDLNTVEAYDPQTNTWSPLASMNMPRSGAVAAVGADGRIYAVGGYHNGPVGTVEVYDPKTNTWSTLASLHTPRAGLAAAAGADGRIYALGGYDSTNVRLTSVEAYDPATNTWTTVASIGTARDGLAAAKGGDGRIYAMGGNDASGQKFSTVEALSFAPVTVTDAALTATAVNVSATEGASFTGPVATFTDGKPGDNHAEMSATIDWGNGTSSGVVSYSGGTYTVTGTNTYGEEGKYAISVTIHDAGGATTVTATGWSSAASMTNATTFAAAAAGADGQLYVFGGYDGSSPLNQTAAYNIGTNAWTLRAPMPTALHSAAAAANSDGKIYVVGGYDGGSVVNSAQAYDPINNTWTLLPGMSTPRYRAAAGAVNGVIYVFGGANASFTTLSSAEKYVPGTGWSPIASLPSPLADASAVVGPDGRIYIMGGFLTNAVLAYDPVSNSYSSVASMTTAREDFAAGLGGDGRIYAAGGAGFAGMLDSAEAYDFGTHAWTALPNMSAVRYAPTGAAGQDGRFYVFGGRNNSAGFLKSVEAYSAGGLATVADPDLTSVAGVTLPDIAEGTATIAAGTPLATFTDPGGAEAADQYAATIHWGDGSSETGLVTGTGGNSFKVTGTAHTYSGDTIGGASEGTASITVDIQHLSEGPTLPTHTVTNTVNITDPTIVATGVAPFALTEGSATLTDRTVATFTDPGGPEEPGDYSATINWGDGTIEAGTISAPDANGVFTVSGNHTYTGDTIGGESEGGASISVTITHEGKAAHTSMGLTPSSTLSGFSDSYGTTTDGSGNLYVAESIPGRVAVFAPGSTSPTSFLTGLTNPTWLAFDKSGDLFVASAFSSQLWEFTPGSTTPTFTLSGANNPQSILIDAGGDLFVSNYNSNTVGKYAPGSLTPTDILTGLNGPTQMALDPAGDLFVINSGNSTVSKFLPGNTTPAATLTGLSNPQFAASDASGNLFVTNFGNDTVSEFGVGSTTPTTTLTGLSNPLGLAFDGSGNLFVTNYYIATVSEFAPASTTPTATLTGSSHPEFLAFDPQGSLYVSSGGGSSVSKFSPVTIPDVTDSVTITDPGVQAIGGKTFTVQEGSATFTNVTLATFTDPGNPNPGNFENADDYSATIAWGDGQTDTATLTSGGIVNDNDGTFSVVGSHTYVGDTINGESEGPATITVTISHDATTPQVVTSTAVISDPALSATGNFTVTGSEASATGSQTVAIFTDPAGYELDGDYSATINWGGTGTGSTIGAIHNGVVTGSFIYAEEGTYTVTVTISHDATTAQVVTSTAVISDPALSATGNFTVTGSEASATGSQTVATFTDPAGYELDGDYSATINWGGTGTGSTIGAIHNGVVTGNFTYAEEGSYVVTVTIHHDGATPDAVVTSTAVISDPALSATGNFTVTGSEASATGSQTVATFTDPAGYELDGDYSATINWGGAGAGSTVGTIHNGVVTGNFTYAEEGSYIVTVTIHHEGATPQVVTSTAVISDPALSATGNFTVTGSEASATGSQTVATFTDPAGYELDGDYSATINWGGTGTGSTIGAIHNGVVTGSFIYAEEGTYTVTVTIHHEGATPQVVTSTAVISDPAVVATGGKSITAVEGSLSTSQVVATFTDPAGAEVTGDYSATINWGDNTAASSADKITVSGGVFSVYGSHNYAEESGTDHPGSNPYQITVTVHHEMAADSNQVTSSATVADAALSATGKNFAGVECLPTLTVTVATFTDMGGPEMVGDYSASINWGGAGTGSTTGAIVANGDGSFNVQGSFAYAHPGVYSVTVTITHEHGVTAITTNGTATIQDNIGILLLDKTGKGALTDTGNGNITVTGCGDIIVDSSNVQAAIASGKGVVSAAEIDVKGTVSNGHGAFLGVMEAYNPVADPLISLSPGAPPVPAAVRSTSTLNISGGVVLLQPGRYIGGIKISGQAQVTLAPGLYYLDGGGFSVSGQATVSDNGQGVMLYNAPKNPNDVITFAGQGDVHLTGLSAAQLPAWGLIDPRYAGLAIYQDRNSTATLSVTGQGNVYIIGTVYAASATIKVTGQGSLNLTGSASKQLGSHLIAADLMVTGNGGVNVDASNNNLELL